MRVGLDTFTIRELKLDPFQTLDYIRDHGLDGAQFGALKSLSPALDLGVLQAIRSRADEWNLYSHVSVPSCNPYLIKGDVDAHCSSIERQIEIAAACGWHELHASLGNGPERYEHPIPWTQHLADSAAFLARLAPCLRANGSRVNLETHGDSTTFELIRLIEKVGADVVGICLDTANVLCHAEDPAEAAKRAAPYTHLTHTKDAIIWLTEDGYRRQTLPIGRGALDWRAILPALAAHAPDLPLSIEDHKWLFDFNALDPAWLRLHPDLTREELASVLRLAVRCGKRIEAGELRDPEEYEKVLFVEEVEERLTAGRDFLWGLLSDLGLAASPCGAGR